MQLSAATGLALLLGSGNAFAYCRETTCDIAPTPASCKGEADANGCTAGGIPLAWGKSCFSFSVNARGSPKLGITSQRLQKLIGQAFDTWAAVNCQEGHPGFVAIAYPEVECDEVGFRPDGPNQNLWTFRDHAWFDDATMDGVLALTTLSVLRETGEIYDADVELNAHQNVFTLGDEAVGTDLFSVVLHEAGHVLGIGHSPWSTSTMDDAYAKGTLDARSLEADDINAICDVMPPRALEEPCDPEPRRGFASHCDSPNAGCCSVARGGRSRPIHCFIGLACCAALARMRRKLATAKRPE